MKRPLFAAALALLAAPALADDFAGLSAVSEAELDEARGGFLIENGRVAGLSVEILTSVDGRQVLTTTLDVGPNGSTLNETPGTGVTAADAAALRAAAARGLDVRAFAGDRVFFVGDRTAVVHRISGGALQNLIVNAADGRELTQSVAVRVDLYREAAIADQLAMAGLRVAMDQADAVRIGFR